jgi:transcriptional regulator with XRE-family HTH domain
LGERAGISHGYLAGLETGRPDRTITTLEKAREGPESAGDEVAEVTNRDREQLKRECADALEALHRT